jgi:tetratricopeptide (TPR) repeat protein
VREAVGYFERALALDPEDAAAHWNLYLAYRELGDPEEPSATTSPRTRYRPDDNARDRAVSIARAADPAADHAAEAIVLYDLRRPGAFGFDESGAPPVPPPITADSGDRTFDPGVPAS